MEAQFGAEVEIEAVQGELLENIVLKNAILYREFRENQVLLRASEVQIKVDLVSGIFKEKALIRSLKKLTFRDFDLYIDEDLSRSEIFKTLFVGRGTGEGIRSLEIELEDGRVHSDFSDPRYPALEILDLDLTVELKAPSVSIEGTGFLREKKGEKKGEKKKTGSFLYGTETPFHLQMDNFNQAFQGVLDLKELHYMGGVFRSVALAFNERIHERVNEEGDEERDEGRNGERTEKRTERSLKKRPTKRTLSVEMKPSDHAPFLASLSEEERNHYRNGMAYKYLPRLYLEYSFNSSLFHLGVSAEEANRSISDVVLYYMAHSPLKEYQKYLHPSWNGEFLGSFDLWLSGKGIEFLLRVDETRGLVNEGDRLSFELEKRIGQAFMFRDIVYSGAGSIEAEGFFDPETQDQDFQLRVKKIPLRWIPLDTFVQIAQSSGRLMPWFERIYWEEDFFSGKIHFFAKDGTYHVEIMNPRVSIYPLWNTYASFSIQETALHFGLEGFDPFEYKIEGVLPWEPGSLLQLNLRWDRLQYQMIQKLLFLDSNNPVHSKNFGNFGMGGEISASVDLENWQNSKVSGLLKLSLSENGDQKDRSITRVEEEKSQDKKQSEPFFRASFGYEKNRFVLYDSNLKNYGMKLSGKLAWNPRNFEKVRSEWVLLYSEDRYDLDLELDSVGPFYRTKLRVDKNQFPWVSLHGDWALEDSRLDIQRVVLSDGTSLYDLVGFLDWKKKTIQSDLLLLARESSRVPLVHLKGNLWFSGSAEQIEIFPDFSLRIRDLSIGVVGSVSLEDQRWFPNLQFTWALQEQEQKTLGLKGWVVQESNQFESQLSFSYEEKNYLGHFTLISLEGAWDYSILVDGLSLQSLGIKGRIYLVEAGLESQLFLFQKEVDKENILLESKANLSFRGNRLYTHWIFDADGNRLDLDGYVEQADSGFLTRFQIQFFQQDQRKNQNRKLSWWWDAVIRKNKNHWELKGKIDSGIRVHGLFEDYSKLSLDFWLDDLRFPLGKGRYLTFDSFFETTSSQKNCVGTICFQSDRRKRFRKIASQH